MLVRARALLNALTWLEHCCQSLGIFVNSEIQNRVPDSRSDHARTFPIAIGRCKSAAYCRRRTEAMQRSAPDAAQGPPSPPRSQGPASPSSLHLYPPLLQRLYPLPPSLVTPPTRGSPPLPGRARPHARHPPVHPLPLPSPFIPSAFTLVLIPSVLSSTR